MCPKEKLTDKETEKSLSAFSERARGDRKPNTGVASDDKPQTRQKTFCRRFRVRSKSRTGSLQLRASPSGSPGRRRRLRAPSVSTGSRASDGQSENGYGHLARRDRFQIIPAEAARTVLQEKERRRSGADRCNGNPRTLPASRRILPTTSSIRILQSTESPWLIAWTTNRPRRTLHLNGLEPFKVKMPRNIADCNSPVRSRSSCRTARVAQRS